MENNRTTVNLYYSSREFQGIRTHKLQLLSKSSFDELDDEFRAEAWYFCAAAPS